MTSTTMDEPTRKQAACLVCRKSKIKCDWMPEQERCKRCIQLDEKCIRPNYHVGRQRGIKNKRVGIDKALYQIDQAVKKAKTSSSPKHQSPDSEKVVNHLRELLSQIDGGSSANPPHSRSAEEEEDWSSEDGDSIDQSPVPDFAPATEERLAVDDAENPLQLLARASYFHPPNELRNRHSPQQSRVKRSAGPGQPSESAALHRFFTPGQANLDVGDDVDPISLGLVTEEEADQLFQFFHAHLAHTRWGMDTRIYTMEYTRSRSAFLFTSLLASSALFIASAGALSKRLFNHSRSLAHRVMTRRHKSVEIVLAFMVNVPWMFPGDHSTDDETCAYISTATTIAIDLSLHKTLVPTEVLQSDAPIGLARGECLDTQSALAIDGFPDMDPRSERGELLIRGRERCWIALFVVERGMCLARGRPFVVPMTRFLKDCDTWHQSPLADPQDGHLLSMAVLRRNLDGLFNTVRALCDGSRAVSTDGSIVAENIQSAIERFFDQWYAEWGVSIGTGPQQRLPPYVEILVTHTRLSTYGGVINHPTAPMEVRRFFRTAGLSSALNVMRVAIQGETQLRSMPNNTAIMISFAACFALTLSAYATGGSALAPSIRKLIDETASVLERVGQITPHRNGLSILYGKHLRQIVRRAARKYGPHATTAPSASTSVPPETNISPSAPVSLGTPMTVRSQHSDFMDQQHQHQQHQQLPWAETLPFSTMSDDQIAHVLNQPGNEFDTSFRGLSWQDMNNFDWLYWPEFPMASGAL